MKRSSKRSFAMWLSKSNNLVNAVQSKSRGNPVILFGEQQKKDIRRLMAMKFKHSDGKWGDMFATVVAANGLQKYCCLLCSKNDMGVVKFISHAKSKNHNQKLRSVSSGENSSSPSLSVPNIGGIAYGNGGQVVSELQAHLDTINDQVIVGVEYIIEVYVGECFESIFHCVLCEERFDRQVIVNHLTSFAHRVKYLKKHFPTAFKRFAKLDKRERKYILLEKICHSIENHFGRLPLTIIQRNEFAASQFTFYERVLTGTHFDERMGQTFTELFDDGQNSGFSPISDFEDISTTSSLQSISTSSELMMSPYKASGKVLLSSIASSTPYQKSDFPSVKSVKRQQSGDGSLSGSNGNGTLLTHSASGEKCMKRDDYQRDRNEQKKYESTDIYQSNAGSWKKFTRKLGASKEDRFSPQTSSSLSSSRQSRIDAFRSPYQLNSSVEAGIGSCGVELVQNKEKSRIDFELQRKSSTVSDGGYESPLALCKVSKVGNGTATAAGYNFEGYSPIQTSIESEADDEEGPITIISVLSLVSGFESLLGSLGPKMVALMTEAIAMEKIEVNASNHLLDNNNHYIVFDTTKEKLKGYIRAGLVHESNKQMAIKKIIANMNVLMGEANARKQLKYSLPAIDTKEHSSAQSSPPMENHDRSAIAAKMRAAFKDNGRADISEVELAHYVEQYVKMANAKQCAENNGQKSAMNPAVEKMQQQYSSALQQEVPSVLDEPLFQPTTLSDTNLTILIKNFCLLSDIEKQDVIACVRDIEVNDPERMKRLGNQMQIAKILTHPKMQLRKDKSMSFNLKSEIA